MIEVHQFLIVDTCYWHHEWEHCGICGVLDKPDDPEQPYHLHHNEEIEVKRQRDSNRHPA